MRRLLLAVAVLASPGCDPLECTVEELYGVELRITETGPPSDAPISITWSVEGGPTMTIAGAGAASTPNPDAYCTSRTTCFFGREVDGDYVLEVSRDMAGSVSIEAEVLADRCHVEPVVLPIDLDGI